MLDWEEALLILGLSLDGFAASVCLGMELGRRWLAPVVATITGFHVGMLLCGCALGAGIRGLGAGLLPWAAGAILLVLGANMLRTAGEEEPLRAGGAFAAVAALAFATSVDALTVGVALALMGAAALPAGTLTAAVMGALSLLGGALGGRAGIRWRRGARLSGGATLALLGLKTVLAALV